MCAAALALVLALASAGCGNLDNVTTVKDLRVLAVKTEPAGFLVDLDNPGGATEDALRATITALVVDPIGAAQELSVSAMGCPDYIDTITSATGKGSKICPQPVVSMATCDSIPSALATVGIAPPAAPVTPDDPAMIEYAPAVSFGLEPCQVGLFFSPTMTGVAAVDQSVAYNRDFGLPAVVNLTFGLGAESAVAIKRVVYWPRLAPDEQPNQNPELDDLLFFHQRDATTGQPVDPWTDAAPTVSQAAGDRLYVQPSYPPGAAESYLLRVKNDNTGMIETRMVSQELLTFQFYATAGTFAPAQTQSQLSPVFTSPDGLPHTDSLYNPPKPADIPAAGETVTIWVVTRDERAGTSWMKKTITVVP
jgi:hypothetical protein